MAGSIFDGLESLGIKNIDSANLFSDSQTIEDGAGKEENLQTAKQVFKEEDFLLDKSYICPVCSSPFKCRTVKANRARLVATDIDLRPVYQQLDVIKYDVVACPVCGYASLVRYFDTIVEHQKKLIREKISSNFLSNIPQNPVYTYEDALQRYKLALANAVVKNAKDSEKAYICLKSAWIIRGMCEQIGKDDPAYDKTKEVEREYLENAFEGFYKAFHQESFPMCSMDVDTVSYLIGALALETKHYDVCAQMISKVLSSKVASARIKDRTRELKDILIPILRNS